MRHSFGLRLPYFLGGVLATVALVQLLVRVLVDQYRQGFCFRHAGPENDSAAVGDAIGLHRGVAVFEGYA